MLEGEQTTEDPTSEASTYEGAGNEMGFPSFGSRSRRSLLRSDKFCFSLALVVAMCFINLGFQYGAIRVQHSQQGVSGVQPGAGGDVENARRRKLSNIVDYWETEDDGGDDVELVRRVVKEPKPNKIEPNKNGKHDGRIREALVVVNPGNQGDVKSRQGYDQFGLPPTCQLLRRPRSNVVIYNALTMCASHVLLNMAKYANNRLFVEDLKDQLLKSSYPEKDLVKYVDQKPRPSLFHAHTRFCSLLSTEDRNVSYISMVRNPLERLIALYNTGTQSIKAAGGKVKNYDECVKGNDTICVGNWTRNTLVRHFCGYDDRCAIESKWALDKAKQNIANSYLVIGDISNYERHMLLLERLAPTVFRGYSELEIDMEKILDKRIFGSNLHKLSPEARTRMEKHLTLDFQLYYFIKQRFTRQLQLCRIT